MGLHPMTTIVSGHMSTVTECLENSVENGLRPTTATATTGQHNISLQHKIVIIVTNTAWSSQHQYITL
jgi:hypothetical protein